MSYDTIPQINLLFAEFNSDIFVLIFKILFIGTTFLIFKNFMENVVGYITFRSNSYVCLNKRIIIDDFEGIIKKVGFKFIVVEGKEQILIVKTSHWKERRIRFYININ